MQESFHNRQEQEAFELGDMSGWNWLEAQRDQEWMLRIQETERLWSARLAASERLQAIWFLGGLVVGLLIAAVVR